MTSAAGPLYPRGVALTPATRGVVGVLALAVLMEALPRLGVIDAAHFPPFSEILSALSAQIIQARFWDALLSTLTGWFIGLSVAFIAAVVIGMVVGAVPILRRVTNSTLEFLRPIPSVALIPLAVILFGTDMQSTLVLVIYASFWQVFIQVLYGVQDVDPVASETARSYRFGRLTRIRAVTWPTALPYVMTGFRLGATVALILEITGELVIGTPGIGREIAVAQSSGAVPRMFSLVMVTGLLGVLMNVLARRVERRVLRWHLSVRRELPA